MTNSVTLADDAATADGRANRRARPDPKARHFPESQFGGYSDIDQLVVFYTRVRSLLEPSFTVLDIGCGRGKHAQERTARSSLKILNDHCKTVIGIDVNPAARDNPFVDQFHLIGANSRWPLPDASVDLAVSDYVLEHVENPDLFFSECHRVIRPGGYLCMRTTNALSYFGVAARVIPDGLHPAIVQQAYVNPRKEEDVFPTVTGATPCMRCAGRWTGTASSTACTATSRTPHTSVSPVPCTSWGWCISGSPRAGSGPRSSSSRSDGRGRTLIKMRRTSPNAGSASDHRRDILAIA